MIKKFLKVLLSFLILGALSLCFWIGGTILQNASSDLPYQGEDPDFVLILGCRIEDDQPGKGLLSRIETAASFLHAHPDAFAVCTGGQGKDEIMDEATVIKNKLIELGIEEERILLEKESQSTLENFTFSKTLLDETMKGEPYRIAFVTNEFHVYRSRMVADFAGFEKPVALSAPSPSLYFYASFPREIAAVAYYQFKLSK